MIWCLMNRYVYFFKTYYTHYTLFCCCFFKDAFHGVTGTRGLESRDVIGWFVLAGGQNEKVTFKEWFTLVSGPVSYFKLSRLLQSTSSSKHSISGIYC